MVTPVAPSRDAGATPTRRGHKTCRQPRAHILHRRQDTYWGNGSAGDRFGRVVRSGGPVGWSRLGGRFGWGRCGWSSWVVPFGVTVRWSGREFWGPVSGKRNNRDARPHVRGEDALVTTRSVTRCDEPGERHSRTGWTWHSVLLDASLWQSRGDGAPRSRTRGRQSHTPFQSRTRGAGSYDNGGRGRSIPLFRPFVLSNGRLMRSRAFGGA